MKTLTPEQFNRLPPEIQSVGLAWYEEIAPDCWTFDLRLLDDGTSEVEWINKAELAAAPDPFTEADLQRLKHVTVAGPPPSELVEHMVQA